MVSIYRPSGNSVLKTGGYIDPNIKLTVVSQILPNGKERTKDDVRQEEIKKRLNKNEDNIVLRAATYLLKTIASLSA